jgi:L-rhamnose isomerase/sugar isomerase
MDAFYTDVRPLLSSWREQRGLPADPMNEYLSSGHHEKLAYERLGGTQASWGA